ncbi:major facilitator superfamily transporter [Thozetella sp. PMI_491]|nr:major facilitator superfamily transporter [Thozetella sp. PMI_491]
MSDEKKELVASVGDVAAQDAREADVADDAGPLTKADSNIKPVTIADDPSPSPDAVSIVSSVEARETYPEGGAQAWLVVLGSWLAMFASLGLLNVLATFQTYIVSHQLSNYDAGTIGWIFSLYTFLSFFLGIYVGPLFDRYGPRWLILAGTVCTVTGLMLLSVSFEYWHFLLAFGLLSGTGTALLFTPSIAVIGHYFNEKRGLATGVASTAGSVGGILFPLMLDGLFVRVGWAWAIRILGFLCLAVTFVANFLIRSRLPPSPNARPHPDPRIFGSLAFSLTTAAVFFLEFALFIPLTYISGYALSKGFSERFAFDILTILNTGSFCGRLLVGYWADRVGAFNANMICVLATVIACFGLWLPAGDTTPGLIIFAIIFGFCSGSNISLVPVAISRLCKTQEYGRYYATTYTIVSTACLIGIPIGGKIITDNDGDYWGLIVTTGMFYVASLATFLAAKVSLVGWNVWAIL